MSPPLLTIGLPVYNDARHLPGLLSCLLAQSFTDWELIVVDDGSTDKSLETFSAVADPRIRLLRDGRHLGLAARLNQIAGAARGRFVARMDANDLIHPARFGKQVEQLLRHPELDGVGCSLLVIDERMQLCGMRILPTGHERICAAALQGIRLAHATFTTRREWLLQHPYNEANHCCEDAELWWGSYAGSRFANLPDPLYVYREFESYSLSKYLRAKLAIARLQWKQRRTFGVARTAGACAMQGVRMAVNIAVCPLGRSPWLVQRRSTPTDERAESLWLATPAF